MNYAPDRPRLCWRDDAPPPSTKVISLTRYGILQVGPVSGHEWRTGFIVCWQHCPKRPDDWKELQAAAEERARQ